MNYWNHVVINTGNFLHVLRVNLISPKSSSKNQKLNDKQDSGSQDTMTLDVSDVEESDYLKTDSYEILDEKFDTPGSVVDQSPKCESNQDPDYLDDRSGCDLPLNTSNGNRNDCICDISKSTEALSFKTCECLDNSECKVEQQTQAISVRDKILQDFCDDMSQELNIGSDLITLVKHSSCSPRSTPQRLPADLKAVTTWCSTILTPPSDILRTRNSETSQKHAYYQRPNSPQPGASQGNMNPISSPFHSISINPSPSSSPRLMSPPITRSFRYLSPRKRANLHSPPPTISQSRTRTTHKLILEAEKAYEFTDDAQETCEKLSSFRKRRLADKKYEFCDESEDAENIVPFRHIRDQFKHRPCSIHQMSSPVMSPVLPNSKKYWLDSDLSETDEFNSISDINTLNDLTVNETSKFFSLLNHDQHIKLILFYS